MRNLYLNALVYLLLLQIPVNSYGQKSDKVDSCKFALSVGFTEPPVKGWINTIENPFYAEASYYFNPGLSIDLAFEPVISILQWDYPESLKNYKETGFISTLCVNGHMKITKWLSLVHGEGFVYQYTNSWSYYLTDKYPYYFTNDYNTYAFGLDVTWGFEIKLYKNLSLYNMTDLALGYNWGNNYRYIDEGYYNNALYPAIFRAFSLGLKVKF